MTTEDLEKLIEAGTETIQVDYKASMAWKVQSFVKDFLAMSNLQDGGWLIIGVKENDDGTYERTGILPEHKSTYIKDTMKDQLSPFTDPYVDFLLDTVSDANKLEYVVIKIEPFKEIPVICKRNGREVREGTIYYRNTNRRVESAAISNSTDMRDLIERAMLKMRYRARNLGYPLSSVTEAEVVMKALDERLKVERGDL